VFEFPEAPAHGTVIEKEDLEKLLTMLPRRHRLNVPSWHNLPWVALQAPAEEGNDWRLNFPFFETYCPAFDEFCAARRENKIERLPFERKDGSKVPYTYLKNTDDQQRNDVGAWVKEVSSVVGLRDFLRVSFALDFTCAGGDPSKGLTEVAKIRQTAKLYGEADEPTTETIVAAGRLAEGCIRFMKESRAYSRADAVMAIPRSHPAKKYSLPGFIADRIAKDLDLANLSEAVRTVKPRREMKDTPAEERLAELEGTLEVTSDAVKGKRTLIVDDLYQSGTTINYVGMLLLESQATCVYGLCCEKTCSNQD